MVIANLQMEQPKRVSNIRRQDRRDPIPRVEFDDGDEVESENEDDKISMAKVGRMRNSLDRHEEGIDGV